MKIHPLTKQEAAWLKKAQKLFAAAPARFEFIATGDPLLQVVDKEGAANADIHDGRAERNGIVLGLINTKGSVHATTA